jgi:hypothetical protein
MNRVTLCHRLPSPGALAVLAGLVAGVTALGGCTTAGGFAGAAAGIATGTFTSNPAIGLGIGVAVQASTDAAIARYSRGRHQFEQDNIAAVVGPLEVGERRQWEVRHTIPIGNERGEAMVTRLIENPLTTCKEIAFTVVDGEGEKQKITAFTSAVCASGGGWKWASAEPAVTRWGSLQ